MPRPQRRAIWLALGSGEAGQEPRARLAQLAAEKVKPVWDATYPGDGTFDELLATARRALDGGVDYQAAERRVSQVWHEMFERMSDESRFPATYAGQAAAAALRVSIDDEAYDYGAELDEYELDAEAWDTAWLAALAYGGGDKGEAAYRPELRREFWEWYLDEAVPAAWNQ